MVFNLDRLGSEPIDSIKKNKVKQINYVLTI